MVQFFGEIFYAYFPFDSMQTLWALGLNINCKLPFLSNRFLCQTVTGKMGKMFHLPFLLRESGSIYVICQREMWRELHIFRRVLSELIFLMKE